MKLRHLIIPWFFIIVIIFTFIFFSCNEHVETEIKTAEFQNKQRIEDSIESLKYKFLGIFNTPYILDHEEFPDQSPVYVIVIDSCEYVGRIRNRYSDFLTHKGNCRFCEQRKKHR